MAILPAVVSESEWLYEEVSQQYEYSGSIVLTNSPDSITGSVEEVNVRGTIVRSRELCDITGFSLNETNFVVPVADFGTDFSELPSLAFNSLIIALVLSDERVEQESRDVWRHIQVWDAVSTV